ncbi:MAG: dihydrodipicolinate synthase family protein [Candidatus Odinarchaeia archaeon]
MLHGIYTALITPFNKDGKVNSEGFNELMNFIRKKGINGFVVNGTTGLYPYLSLGERKNCIDYVMSIKKRDDRIIVCAGHTNMGEVIEIVNYCKNKDVEAILLPPPYYIKLDDKLIIDFYKKVKSNTELPIIAYNIPQLTNNPLTVKTLERLASKKLVNGVKDTSGDFLNYLKFLLIREVNKDFRVLIGDDYLCLSALLMGGQGAILASCNYIPEKWHRLFNLVKSNNITEAAHLQLELVKFIDAMFIGTFPSAIYYILRKKGVECGKARPPLSELNETEIDKIDKLIF